MWIICGGEQKISWYFTVENVSDQTFEAFHSLSVPDPTLDPYPASGVVIPDDPKGFLVVPEGSEDSESGGRRMEVRNSKLLADRQVLEEMGKSVSQIPALAENYSIQLRCEGGKELIEMSAPLLDPYGVLEE